MKNIITKSVPAAGTAYYVASRNVFASNNKDGSEAAERVAQETIPDLVEIIKQSEDYKEPAIKYYNQSVQGVFKDLARAPDCLKDTIKTAFCSDCTEKETDDVPGNKKQRSPTKCG